MTILCILGLVLGIAALAFMVASEIAWTRWIMKQKGMTFWEAFFYDPY